MRMSRGLKNNRESRGKLKWIGEWNSLMRLSKYDVFFFHEIYDSDCKEEKILSRKRGNFLIIYMI
jgi:hypothetical protein